MSIAKSWDFRSDGCRTIGRRSAYVGDKDDRNATTTDYIRWYPTSRRGAPAKLPLSRDKWSLKIWTTYTGISAFTSLQRQRRRRRQQSLFVRREDLVAHLTLISFSLKVGPKTCRYSRTVSGGWMSTSPMIVEAVVDANARPLLSVLRNYLKTDE